MRIDWVGVLHPIMHASGYVRCPWKGHGIGRLWLLLLKPNTGDDYYEIHRHTRWHFKLHIHQKEKCCSAQLHVFEAENLLLLVFCYRLYRISGICKNIMQLSIYISMLSTVARV